MSIHEELRTSTNWRQLLYTQYHAKVLGICVYFLKDREEAKDAAHDVFIKAFHAWGEFEWKCDPLTWIGAIAKHDCFSRIQKNRKQLDRRTQLAHEDVVHQHHEEENLILHRMRLQKVMPQVRGKLKEILRLSLDQGLNHREIAIRMGVSRVAITRRLTRFKRDLQGLETVRTTTSKLRVRGVGSIHGKRNLPSLVAAGEFHNLPVNPMHTSVDAELRLQAA